MAATEFTITPNELLEAMHWRYAVHKFDPAKKIPDNIWRALEETLVLTASSWGLQPWRFYVVTDSATKEKIKPAAWRQSQVVDASHLVVFAIKKGINAADVGRFLGRVAEVKNVPLSSLDRFKKILVGFVETPPEKLNIDHWSAKQTYIALGNFLTAAAVLGVDTCPMEGFEPAKVDEIIDCAKDGYASVVMCAAGYRAADDAAASAPKVRYKLEDVVSHIS